MIRKAVGRCLLSAVLFGVSAPAASVLTGTISTFTLAGLLYVGAAIAVLPSIVRNPPTRSALRADWRPALAAVIVGGGIGPVLLVQGLATTNPATASILLNAELPATVLIATLFFHEHLGRRVAMGAVLVTIASLIITWYPQQGFTAGSHMVAGAVLIMLACLCWGFDNCVTAGIDHLSAEQVVLLKGLIAGTTNLLIGVSTSGWSSITSLGDVAWALVIGAAGYGLSIVLWVKGARDLGASRAQVIFSSAPFIGAIAAWSILGAEFSLGQLVATLLAACGVALSLERGHSHQHHHPEQFHDHEHTHDDAHHVPGEAHGHGPGIVGPHSHPHRHEPLTHTHPHVPDLHHRHAHESGH